MRFLERIEIEQWCSERGFKVLEDGELAPEPALVVVETRAYGQQAHPAAQEAEVAADCVRHLGEWDECLLWVTQWGVWPSSENWPAYYSARGAERERRSLEKAPGHLFGADETAIFQKFLQLTLENAWDAFLLPARAHFTNDCRVFISHDEWIDVYGRRSRS